MMTKNVVATAEELGLDTRTLVSFLFEVDLMSVKSLQNWAEQNQFNVQEVADLLDAVYGKKEAK